MTVLIKLASGGGAAQATGVCGAWTTIAELCSPCDQYALNAARAQDAIDAASEILFLLSGSKYSGLCQSTVRPCTRRVVDDEPVWLGNGHQPFHVVCGCQRGRRCGCTTLDEITLGGYPVRAVTQVKVDGAVLLASRYRVDDSRYLVRLRDPDGTNPGWPCCQAIDLDDTQPDTFSVSFEYGRDVPDAGRRAAAVLACEFILACDPETVGKCQLPRRVTQVTRQGIQMVLANTRELFAGGRTGLIDVDMWLTAVNPTGVRRPGAIVSPDIPRRVRRTG